MPLLFVCLCGQLVTRVLCLIVMTGDSGGLDMSPSLPAFSKLYKHKSKPLSEYYQNDSLQTFVEQSQSQAVHADKTVFYELLEA